MRLRNSIGIPIVLFLLLTVSSILVAGYYINEQVFYDVFEERESNKAKNIHLIIESMISSEVKRISTFAKILKSDTDLVYGLYHHGVTKGDTKPLKSVMNQLYSQTNLKIFVMANSNGQILYSADKVRRSGKIRDQAGFDRALSGEQVITASRGSNEWGLRALVPMYVLDKSKPAGVLILGSPIDDDFAKRIARETGSQVFISTAGGVVAGSYHHGDPGAVSSSLAKKSLEEKKPFFYADRKRFRSYTYVPLRIVDAEFCLVIETDISVVKDLLKKNKARMAEWGLIIFAGITTIGIAFTFTIVRPLNRLKEKAGQIIREYSGEELKSPASENEISALVRAINSMVDTIKAHIAESRRAEEALRRSEERLRQAQKMEAIGRLAGGVAHDFNNLLSVITGYSELLLNRHEQRGPNRREIEEIHKAGERAASLTQQLLAFSRRQVMKPKIVHMNEAASNIGRMLRRLIGENIELVLDIAPDVWTIEADPNQIDQVLMNLAVNARDAMPGGGRLRISTANLELAQPLVDGDLNVPVGRYVALVVADNGSGMDEETLSRIFEPFFSTKEVGKGTGLGLATVYGIVKQSGGFIRAQSLKGCGATFTVYFPRSERADADAGAERDKVEHADLRGDETILVVEDEAMVRELACESLRGFGYSILEASNGGEALSVSERFEGTIHLLVTDVVMPGMDGFELARNVSASRPDIPVLFMSGYAEEAVTHLGVRDNGKFFLQKPVTPTRLSSMVREILGGRLATVLPECVPGAPGPPPA